MEDASCIWPLGALLGEGPVWSAACEALWFTDIKGRSLHRYTPATGARSSFPLPGGAGFVVPAQGGGLVIGMDDALYRFGDGRVGECLGRADAPPGTRINDGTVDRAGRIWFGTMDLGETDRVGAIHMFDGQGDVRNAGGEAVITNGPAISIDGTQLYHVDTVAGLIWRFRVADDHILRDGTVIVTIDPADGYPDGVTVDAEDCLWVGLWGGSCVRRYTRDGVWIGCVHLPVSQVTKLAFGGDGLRTAFVTSARAGLTQEALRAQPLAGGLFAFDAGVAGVAMTPARLS